MILHFLRHAQAEPYVSAKHHHDRERLLTAEGRAAMTSAARGFLKMGVNFKKVVSSPYPRAVETAQIVSDVFGFHHPILISEALTPDSMLKQFKHEFSEQWCKFESILFVTHQPFVSECISALLLRQNLPMAVNMGTGTLCSLEVDPQLKGPAILNSMVTSEQAALIGG